MNSTFVDVVEDVKKLSFDEKEELRDLLDNRGLSPRAAPLKNGIVTGRKSGNDSRIRVVAAVRVCAGKRATDICLPAWQVRTNRTEQHAPFEATIGCHPGSVGWRHPHAKHSVDGHAEGRRDFAERVVRSQAAACLYRVFGLG